jgi:hypothetical protein
MMAPSLAQFQRLPDSEQGADWILKKRDACQALNGKRRND